MARFAWFLGVGLLGVLSSLPARADDSAPPRAAPRGAQVFGTMGRLGIPGRGTVFVIYESTEIGLDEIFHRSRHVLRPPKR